jgi:hypothetical protein
LHSTATEEEHQVPQVPQGGRLNGVPKGVVAMRAGTYIGFATEEISENMISGVNLPINAVWTQQLVTPHFECIVDRR